MFGSPNFFLAGGAIPRVAVSYTFASNTANASLNVTTIGGYSAGKTDVTITVNAGVYLYGLSATNPAAEKGLTLTGGSTGDTITLVNNGYIMGQGGSAGANKVPGAGISLGFNTTINNTNASAYIGGGGGGGAASIGQATDTFYAGGGGGAGGGEGDGAQENCNSEFCWSVNGGAGGTIGLSGQDGQGGTPGTIYIAGAGGGGRIFPGTGGAGGTGSTPGRGGSAGGGGGRVYQGTGGAGGATNANGGAATQGGAATTAGGGGAGWGGTGGAMAGARQVFAAQAGGKAVALNGNTVTWTSGQTARVYGAIS